MTVTIVNVIADQNQTAHWMVSVSLSVYYTKLHPKQPITFLFTMELMKGISQHAITTIQNRSDIVNAWMRENRCGTLVLITIYHG